MHELSDTIDRKFVDIHNVDDWEIETDTGWSNITHICKTVQYDIWTIVTVNGDILECADDHILFDADLHEKYAKDFVVGDVVFTRNGPCQVASVIASDVTEHMFDVRVNDDNHRYWTGNFLSHNTTIINALCYAVYNKPFDAINLPRLINSTNGAKNTLMEIRLLFSKGDDDYEVYRCRGEMSNIQVLMNGDDITCDSVAENDKMIQAIFGMTYDLFTQVVIFSGNSIPFLLLPVSHQRNQIEELFNITLLSEKAVVLKNIIKTTEGSIAIQEAVVREQENAVKLYNRQVSDATLRVTKWDEDRANQVVSLTQQLALAEKVDMVQEKELHQIVAELTAEKQIINSRLLVATRDHRALTSEIKKLTAELSHLTDDKCPYCLQEYAGASDKLAEKAEILKNKQLQFADLDSKITADQNLITECESSMAEFVGALAFTSLAAAVKAEANALTAQQKIDDLKASTNPHTAALQDLLQHTVKTTSYAEIDQLKHDLEHQQFLLRLLTDKNSFIRRRIINRTIPFLNARLMYYTKDFGLPHVVKFDDDMTCSVAEYGRELDYGNLSSGEKKRVNLSLSLAFRDVLHHLHAKVNCLFIDEIDASLDGPGVEAVFKVLKQKTRDDSLVTWIISHRPEAVGRFDRQMIVRKENGFSGIVQDAEVIE